MGEDSDPRRETLTVKVVDVIEKHSLSDKIRREVDGL